MGPIKSNRILLLLIVASMLLLAAFQAFWLRKEYNEQKSILQKETDILFKNTVQALEDSVLQKKISIPIQNYMNETLEKNKLEFRKKQIPSPTPLSIKSLPKKSLLPTDTGFFKPKVQKNMVTFQGNETFVFRETARYMQASKKNSSISSKGAFAEILRTVRPDDIQSVKTNAVGNMNITTVTVADTSLEGKKEILIVNSFPPPDSLRQLFGKVARVVRLRHSKNDTTKPTFTTKEGFKIAITINNTKEKTPQHFTQNKQTSQNQLFINLSEKDSLQIKDIAQVYGQKLQKVSINLPFEVQRKPTKDTAYLTAFISKNLTTASVATSMPIGSSYEAVFPSYQAYLFKKIIPQGFFSFFLLAITGLAFGAIFQNLQRQRRLTQLKNDFISNVTHELKTPIATVSVAIEALQNFGVAQNPAQTKEYLDISKSELNRLSLLVDKILKMATFEQQGLDLNLEPVNVSELVQQVVGSMKIQLEKYRAELHFTPHPLVEESEKSPLGRGVHRTGWVNADKTHLTNVIYNLLDNALKYSESIPKIYIEVQENEAEISLTVSDKGIGIPKEYQAKIFDKFFRVPTGNTHNVKGYGLGLSYVNSVIQQHGGQVKVTSALGEGSTFKVTLLKNL